MNCFSRIIKMGTVFCFLTLMLAGHSLQAGTSGSGGSPANTLTHGKTWGEMSPVGKAQMICAIGAGVAFCVSEIWFIVAGFQASVGWGLFMLFIGGMRSLFAVIGFVAWLVRWLVFTHSLDMLQHSPLNVELVIALIYVSFGGIGVLVFIFKHWDRVRKPLAVFSFGVVALFALAGLIYLK